MSTNAQGEPLEPQLPLIHAEGEQRAATARATEQVDAAIELAAEVAAKLGPTGRPMPELPEPMPITEHGPAHVIAMCNHALNKRRPESRRPRLDLMTGGCIR